MIHTNARENMYYSLSIVKVSFEPKRKRIDKEKVSRMPFIIGVIFLGYKNTGAKAMVMNSAQGDRGDDKSGCFVMNRMETLMPTNTMTTSAIGKFLP